MRRSAIAGMVLACGLSAGVGGLAVHRFATPSVVEAPVRAAPPWQATLSAARSTAEAGSMRAAALDTLNEADSDIALSEALDMLGWVGIDDDVPLLESFVHAPDPVLSTPAIEALGRLGTESAFQILVSMLDDRDNDRNSIVVAIGASGHPDAPDHLEPLLADQTLAWSAAYGLAAHGSTDAVARLARAMGTADLMRLQSIARALGQLSATVPEASVALHAVLDGRRGIRRTAVLTALAEAHDPLVYDVLVEDLRRSSGTQASYAAHALGQLGDPRSIPLLAESARTGHSEVRYAAMSALGMLDLADADRALLDMIDTAPAPLAARAVGVLRRVDDPETVERLLSAGLRRPTEVRSAISGRLFSAPWPPGEVPEAVLELARATLEAPRIDGWGVDPVSLLLTHGDPADMARVETMLLQGSGQLRSSAVWSLQRLAVPEAQRLLILLADDPDPSVRQAALTGMLERGMMEEVEQRLIEHLEAGTMDYGASEHLLVRIGTPRAMKVLLERIETGTSREWSGAVSAIASSGSAEDVQRLLALAERTDNLQLEQQILSSLVYSETADLQRVVDRALESGSPQLEATATQALVRLGTPEASEKLLSLAGAEASETRQAALSALAQVGGPEAEAALIDALGDPDAAWAAVSGLSQLGTEPAREALIDAAKGGAPPEVRASVISQLPWMHGVDGPEILGEAIHGDDDAMVRSSAISALESLGSSQAAEALAGLLDDPDISDEDQSSAASSLQRLGGRVAEQHADRIEELAPAVDTGLGMAPGYFDF